ncbi:MAG TPA: carboxypeptidase-like regulatory domain-containing protein [Bryobacteraceae bacterium]|nr:carboxypeptidase-like regulatory domain-containing protein [Bryobacteraceae bacterium]
MRRAFTAFVCLFALETMAPAQEFRASISGHVLDKSGASIPHATVQAANTATNETATASTDTAGSYSLPLLNPGIYRLTVSASGFKQYVRENISLVISQAAGIDVTMEVGDVNQSVSVTAEAAMLETQTANRSGLVDTQQVQELPLNARNPFMLGLTAAGVTFRGAPIWQRPFDNGAIADWTVNGSWQESNEFLMDGSANNAQMGTNNIAYVPIVDAVQEFTMMQNTYDAQYGHTMGGIMNVVSKSGTGKFHGSAYEFMRRTWLDDENWLDNARGAPKTSHYLDQYGGTVGGQIVIPKLLKRDGWAKLFYFGAFENYREGTPDPLLLSFPTAEMRQGDFSKLVDAQGRPITIYDPNTAQYDAAGNILVNRSPFPGNLIPASRINPIALTVSKYMPMPTTGLLTPGQRYGIDDYSLPNVFDKDRFYNMSMKFDWSFGDKHHVSVDEASNDRTEHRPVNGLGPGGIPGTGVGEDGQLPFQRINDRYVLDWTATLTPTLVTDIRASNTRFIEKGLGADNTGFDLTSLGLPASLVNQLPQPRFFGVWTFSNPSGGSYNTLGRYQSVNITNSYGLTGVVTKIWKGHTIKAGVDVRRIQYLVDDTGSIFEEDFNGGWTQAIYNQNTNGLSGDGYATFLLGYPTGGQSNYPAYPFYMQWYVAPFVQDNWQVNHRLTINWGLRYDVNAPNTEKYNRLNAAFNPNAPSPLAALVPANIKALNLNIPPQFASLYNNLSNLTGSMEFAGKNGYSTYPANIDWFGIQPRIGFAYRFKDKLVARGGYGMFIINPSNDWQQTYGFSNNTPMVDSLDGGRTPVLNAMSNPFPNGVQVPPGSSLGPLTYVGRGFNWFNPNFKYPVSNQFSVGFQYQVSQLSTLEVSYVGSRAAHTQSNFPWDLNPSYHQCSVLYGASTPAGFANPAAYCNQSVPNPFQGIAAFAGTSYYSAATISLNQLMRPFPQFTGGTEDGFNTGHVWYNSMQINYNHRLRNGLNLIANYTLSKQNERWGYLDYYNQPIQYQEGLYYADRPHFIKVTMVYDLPFGKGHSLLSGAHGILGKLVEGWQLNTFFTDSPLGEPANLPNGVFALKNPNLPNVHWGAQKVQIWNNCVLTEDDNGGVTPLATSIQNGCSATDFSNYDWLILPPNYRPNQTNSYRSGNIRVQGTYSMDSSLVKETHIRERLMLQLRAEAFNTLNHLNYMLGNINNSATSPNFGSIIPSTFNTQQVGQPRQIQLAAKLIW